MALAENNAIGKDNKLLWHLSDDLKRFKRLTIGHKIIMGKNTFESLPNGALPGRKNIVISDNLNDCFGDCITVNSIQEAIDNCSDDEESFVIGGGSVYEQFLEHSDRLYITKVHQEFDGDTFFPEIDYSKWKIKEKIECLANEKNEYPFTYFIYEK